MKTLKAIFKLMRPYQWTKNALIFLPLFFHGSILSQSQFLDVMAAFVGFSFIASSIYCFNDIADIETDRQHPKKSKRPLASGALSKRTAIIVLAVLIVSGFLVFYLQGLDKEVFIYALIYIILNVLYTLKLKKFGIIDTFIIALGFVIRIFLGSASGDIALSQWIIIMTFLLALFLSFAKRRDDLIIYQKTGQIQRDNIVQYNLEFLNITFGILASVIIVAYIMYTLSSDVISGFGNKNIYFSTIFVIAGLLRYIQNSTVLGLSDDPTRILFKDWFLLVCVLAWMLYFAIVIYL